jgi:hypothetical protein
MLFTRNSHNAAIVTVWPSGTNHLQQVSNWITKFDTPIVHEGYVNIENELAEKLTIMALYDGEEWLESNCWYALFC